MFLQYSMIHTKLTILFYIFPLKIGKPERIIDAAIAALLRKLIVA